MTKKSFLFNIAVLFISCCLYTSNAYSFWIWTPKDNKPINPKTAAKDTPQEQFNWAMRFFENKEFKRAADEFSKLTDKYADSDLAPEAQYYAGRSFEEMGKYLFAYQSYQKTIDNYPYTKRMKDIIEREYNIAGIFKEKSTPKLIDLELSASIDRAIEIYKKIVENNAFGEYADKSLFNLAECYRRTDKYKESINTYDKLITDYPNSNLIKEAKYELAYTAYESSLASQYDQESTDMAIKKFQKLPKDEKGSALADEADRTINILREKKAESLLNTASFYEKQKKYSSAIIYYKEVLSKFPETESAGFATQKIDILNGKIK